MKQKSALQEGGAHGKCDAKPTTPSSINCIDVETPSIKFGNDIFTRFKMAQLQNQSCSFLSILCYRTEMFQIWSSAILKWVKISLPKSNDKVFTSIQSSEEEVVGMASHPPCAPPSRKTLFHFIQRPRVAHSFSIAVCKNWKNYLGLVNMNLKD